MSLDVKITVAADMAAVQRFRTGLTADGMKALHSRVAQVEAAMISEAVASDPSHATANRLGAAPTGHMAQTAARIESEATAEEAVVKIPRKSRLRAAFGSFDIFPASGKRFLARPDHATTYGKQPSQWPKEAFRFAAIWTHRGPMPALVFAAGTYKGQVAFWLRTSVHIQEDRSLLPWDEMPVLAARVASGFFHDLAKRGAA